MNIIEFISNEGVVTTKLSDDGLMRLPKAGDPIQFKDSKRGRLTGHDHHSNNSQSMGYASTGSFYWAGPDQVSVSGGPFGSIDLSLLSFKGVFVSVTFWNWGDLGVGPGNGIHYTVDRPLWMVG